MVLMFVYTTLQIVGYSNIQHTTSLIGKNIYIIQKYPPHLCHSEGTYVTEESQRFSRSSFLHSVPTLEILRFAQDDILRRYARPRLSF